MGLHIELAVEVGSLVDQDSLDKVLPVCANPFWDVYFEVQHPGQHIKAQWE